MKIAGIIAAAGASHRFGGADKLLCDIAGRPLLAWTLEGVAAASGLDRIVVVHPPHGDAIAALAHEAGFEPIVNANAQAGLADTFARGVAAVDDADAVVLFLGDMPLAPRFTPKLIAAWRAEDALVAAPVRCGRRGHPVLFDGLCFSALKALSGEAGARAVFDAFASRAALIETEDEGVVLDVDAPEDAVRMARHFTP